LPAIYPLRLYWLHAWKYRKFFKQLGEENVIARGPFACALALKLKQKGIFKKVIYDGRGAVKAEFEEYIAPGTALSRLAAKLEKRCVLQSDFRIAVSSRLVKYWESEYGYRGNKHVIIPTSINAKFTNHHFDPLRLGEKRILHKLKDTDIVFVYSGGGAEWQSFHLIRDFVKQVFPLNENYKLLCLMPPGEEKDLDLPEFSSRIIHLGFYPGEKFVEMLSAADYGLLLREDTVTNRVSSPTKFAEYLAAGLEVVITDNVGDYSDFVKEKGVGRSFSKSMDGKFSKIGVERKNELSAIAFKYLSKTGPVLSSQFSVLSSQLEVK
jgi:glycosyltransferase involved in cell wall biosynthesis